LQDLDYHIDPIQIIECKLSKEDHTKLFVIEEFVVVKVVFWDVEYLMSDNSIRGSKDDIGKHTSLYYVSFGLPLSAEKANDQVSSLFLTINIIFMF
jgi:hypothetical protein